jgi:amphi-Trp domain-containing protein
MSAVNRGMNRLSRQHAAEHLTDIAYALTTGGRLKLGDEEVSIPAADHVALRYGTRSEDGCFELEIRLSWEE